MDEQKNAAAAGGLVADSAHHYRYQFIDSLSEARYVFHSASEAVKKVTELGGSRFQYVPTQGEYVQIGQIDGQWQAFEFENGAGSRQVPLPGETLDAIQWREDLHALRAIERRALAVEGGSQPEDAAAAEARAFADAAALRRMDDPVMREDAALTIHEAAQASDAYRAGLTAQPFQRTPQDVAELVARADAKTLAKEVRKGTIIDREPNQIEEHAAARPKLEVTAQHGASAVPAGAGPIDPAFTQVLLDGFDQRGKDYFFKGTDQKAFSDKGERITSKLDERAAIDGMLTCAESKGWKSVHVRGSEVFRRQAWYAARQRGLEVTGYEPTREEAALFPAKSGERALEKPDPPLNTIEQGTRAGPVTGSGSAAMKPLAPEVEQAGIVGPALIAASMDDAHKQIAGALGDKAKVFRAETRAGSYRGEIIGETQMHVIQRISPRMAVIHNKVDVAGGIIGQRGVYAYKGGRAKFAANREQQLQKAGLER